MIITRDLIALPPKDFPAMFLTSETNSYNNSKLWMLALSPTFFFQQLAKHSANCYPTCRKFRTTMKWHNAELEHFLRPK